MAEDNRHPFVGTQVGEPVPGEDPCDGHDAIRTGGRQGPKQGLRTGLHVAVYHEVAGWVQDDRQTCCGHAERCRKTRCAVWCRMA